MSQPDWNGQNIPLIHTESGGNTFAILPVLEFFLEYDEDTIYDLLPSERSYGWDDGLMNTFAWSNNAYEAVYIMPDLSRFGCLPSWFPTTDKDGRHLSPQSQVDRFLYLLELAYGGFLDDHRQADPKAVAGAILELWGNMGEYVDIEAGDGMEWELEP
jgi:hypothetical protein